MFRNQLKCYLLILVTLISQSIFMTAQGETKMAIKQPFLTLDVSFAGCQYKPEVNGVPALEISEGVFNVTVPVNQWLKPGKNQISLSLMPAPEAVKIQKAGQGCDAKVTLQVEEASDKTRKQFPLFTYEYHSDADHIITDKKNFLGTTPETQLNSDKNFEQVDKGGDVKIGPIHIEKIETKNGPGVKISRTIDLPLPFPKWAWFDGETIQNNEQTKNELIKQYEKIWNALHAKQAESLAPLFQQRIKEYAEAFYVPKEQMNVIKNLKEDTQDPNKILGDFIPKYEYLKVFGDGKLAKLTIWDGSASIYFNDSKTDISNNYDIIFMKKNGKWEIIR